MSWVSTYTSQAILYVRMYTPCYILYMPKNLCYSCFACLYAYVYIYIRTLQILHGYSGYSGYSGYVAITTCRILLATQTPTLYTLLAYNLQLYIYCCMQRELELGIYQLQYQIAGKEFFVHYFTHTQIRLRRMYVRVLNVLN